MRTALAILDSVPAFEAFRRLLFTLGWDAIAAPDLETAWAMVLEDPSTVDFILADLDNPGCPTEKLLQRFQESVIFREVPIAVCGSVVDKAVIVRCVQLKAFAFLIKPMAQSKLQEALDRANEVGWRARLFEVHERMERNLDHNTWEVRLRGLEDAANQLRGAPRRILDLMVGKNTRALAFELHHLRGSAGILGFSPLIEVLDALSKAIVGRDGDRVEFLLSLFPALVKIIEERVRNEWTRKPSSKGRR